MILSSFKENFQAINLIGLGTLRYNYVKNIFDKQTARVFKNKLNAELFIHELDNGEIELNELSQIPLYLTIMCFIYIDHVRKDLPVSKIWSRNMHNLIYECIITLLSRVDAAKYSEESATKNAFLKRRSDYPDEKLDFLEFFAFESLLKGTSIFNYEILRKSCVFYFEKNSKSVNARKILQGLTNPSRNNPDIAKQLINNNVFTTVCLLQSSYYFDFPIRRFKDVLASRYIEKNDLVNVLLDNSENKSLFEFIIYFFSFCESDKSRIKILEYLLDSLAVKNSIHYNDLLVACLKNQHLENVNDILYQKVKFWLDNNVGVVIKREVFGASFFSYSVIDFMYQYLQKSNEHYNSFNLVLNLLFTFHRDKLTSIVSSQFPWGATLIGKIIISRFNYLIELEKSEETKKRVRWNELNGVQKSLLIVSLLYDGEPMKNLTMFVSHLSLGEQILLARSFNKFEAEFVFDYRRHTILHPIAFEIGEQVLHNPSIREFLSSACVSGLTHRISIYNSKTARELSSLEIGEKNILDQFETYLFQLSEKEYEQLKFFLVSIDSLDTSSLRLIIL